MRNNTTDIKEVAFGYYSKGLTAKEIGKLLDLSFRTVQNYMSSENWKSKRDELKDRDHAKIISDHEKALRKAKRTQPSEPKPSKQ